ncbi:MAG: right-handed parallel beta-helix repeat-containing protein [Phycisphaerales bacterium]|nr:right-handed parallel beta-helix repeat-containing protein [Phycisphaerales bacterium]
MKRVAIVSAVVLGSAGGAVLLVAGPLDPPAGAVSSSYKTLTEVEPRIAINATNTPGDADSLFRITQPGSYYLTGNISGVAFKDGIEVAASDVTVDLMGHVLAGVANSLQGVAVEGTVSTVTIRNGVVKGWGSAGVNISLASTPDALIESLHVIGNGGNGIFAPRGTVRGCRATANSDAGIRVRDLAVIESCVATSNGGAGIMVEGPSTVRGCVAHSNTGNGFTLDDGAIATECVATSNSGIGIRVTDGSSVVECVARLNALDGISAANRSQVQRCESSQNSRVGIDARDNSSVLDCSVNSNGTDGIFVANDCQIRGNLCDGNGVTGVFAGIHVTSGDCRIENNTCTDNDIGFDVDSAGNILLRNTASGNSTNNWDVVAGNACVVVDAVTSGAVIGSSGGVGPGSLDPSVNFSY